MQALLDAIATMAMPTDAQRVFHGRGGLHPGCEAWTLDAYPPVWLVTKFGAATPEEVNALTAALHARQT
ncbi:MAG: SAM-dependent methyltransferase, partial [Limnohabitans sp.]